jgi:hypothetical protein
MQVITFLVRKPLKPLFLTILFTVICEKWGLAIRHRLRNCHMLALSIYSFLLNVIWGNYTTFLIHSCSSLSESRQR